MIVRMTATTMTTATATAAPGDVLARTDVRLDAAALDAALQCVAADPAIATLRLARANVTPHLAVALADFVATNATLTALDLTGNAIGAHGATCLAHSLRVNKTLRRLVLRDCGLRVDAVVELPAALPPQLAFLDLSENQLDDDAAAPLSALLTATTARLSTLELDLRRNQLTDAGIRQLAAAMQTSDRVIDLRVGGNEDEDSARAHQLIDFCIQRNRRRVIRRRVFEHIARVRQNEPLVTECCIDYVEMTIADADVLSAALIENRGLLRLRLRDNALPPEGTRRILRALWSRPHPSLRALELQDNPFDASESWVQLARVVRECPRLRSLRVKQHDLAADQQLRKLTRDPPRTPTALAGLAHALAHPSTALRELALDGCGLTDRDAGVILGCGGAAWACALESLSLRDNALSDRVVGILARLLERCRGLRHLDLHGQHPSPGEPPDEDGDRWTWSGAGTVARAAATHPSLRFLGLGRLTTFDETALTVLLEALATSPSLVRLELATRERASRCAALVGGLQRRWDEDPERRARVTEERRQRAEADARAATASSRRALARRLAAATLRVPALGPSKE